VTDTPVEASHTEQRRALERFVVGNELLDRIETQIGQSNLFEAVGAVRSELRHSDFLAFLLDPSSNHGLSDFFLKEFLKDAISSTDQHDVSAVEIDTASLSDADVRREWESIDILVRCPEAGIVCSIENKVDSTERLGQTDDYRKVVEREFVDEKHVFIFLSPEKLSA